MILSSTLYLINTSLIYIYAIFSTKISSVHTIKYLYLVNLSTITSKNTKQTIKSYIIGLYYKVTKVKRSSDRIGI